MAPVRDMSGKNVVVTGPTKGGIGYETALALCRFGASMFLGARNATTALEAVESIKSEVPASTVDFAECDLGNLSTIDSFADSVKRAFPSGIDVLVCNAGAQFGRLQKTTEQVEMTFAVCALGHHKLIHLLRPSRVVWVTGDIYVLANDIPDPYVDHAGHQAYMKACLARLLLAGELKRRAEENGNRLEVVCVHPGVIASSFSGMSGFGKRFASAILISPIHGAQASVLAASSPHEALRQDDPLPYYHNKKAWYHLPEDDKARDKEAGSRLFDKCDEICGIRRT